MSIMQERVLSLIPHKPDGKFVHGAKADFARMLGFKSGAIVSDWESGKSDSYKNYLFQISALKGVSVEWLKGETDDPGIKKAPGINAEGFVPTMNDWEEQAENWTDDQILEAMQKLVEIQQRRRSDGR